MNLRTLASSLWCGDSGQALGVAILLFVLVSGCASPPSPTSAPPATSPSAATPYRFGEEVVVRALSQIGTPYRYGGADLGGFDCSGLVYHVYRELGVVPPRTAAAQFDASSRLRRQDLEPGDLVFFRTSGRRISHVGIYAGEGRFVHAPQTGRTVELQSLDDGYYHAHFAGGGRLGPSGPGVASAP